MWRKGRGNWSVFLIGSFLRVKGNGGECEVTGLDPKYDGVDFSYYYSLSKRLGRQTSTVYYLFP